jgi:type VI secretion system protein ImpH
LFSQKENASGGKRITVRACPADSATGGPAAIYQLLPLLQLLEQSQPDKPVTGSTWQVRHEPVRFRPHPGMGFPASEIKGIEQSEHSHLPPTVRITFMGLYGVESPLPTHYIDDITQRREGYEATADFLDIFNHRLIAQYYRIWRKYSYRRPLKRAGRTKSRSTCWGWRARD